MKIVGVTCCTTGIAHTYIAKEKLIQAAKELGFEIKIETQGMTGAEDVLTEADIQEADVVILAHDVKVNNIERFKDKPTVDIPISVVMKKPKSLLLTIEKKLGEQS